MSNNENPNNQTFGSQKGNPFSRAINPGMSQVLNQSEIEGQQTPQSNRGSQVSGRGSFLDRVQEEIKSQQEDIMPGGVDQIMASLRRRVPDNVDEFNTQDGGDILLQRNQSATFGGQSRNIGSKLPASQTGRNSRSSSFERDPTDLSFDSVSEKRVQRPHQIRPQGQLMQHDDRKTSQMVDQMLRKVEMESINTESQISGEIQELDPQEVLEQMLDYNHKPAKKLNKAYLALQQEVESIFSGLEKKDLKERNLANAKLQQLYKYDPSLAKHLIMMCYESFRFLKFPKGFCLNTNSAAKFLQDHLKQLERIDETEFQNLISLLNDLSDQENENFKDTLEQLFQTFDQLLLTDATKAEKIMSIVAHFEPFLSYKLCFFHMKMTLVDKDVTLHVQDMIQLFINDKGFISKETKAKINDLLDKIAKVAFDDAMRVYQVLKLDKLHIKMLDSRKYKVRSSIPSPNKEVQQIIEKDIPSQNNNFDNNQVPNKQNEPKPQSGIRINPATSTYDTDEGGITEGNKPEAPLKRQEPKPSRFIDDVKETEGKDQIANQSVVKDPSSPKNQAKVSQINNKQEEKKEAKQDLKSSEISQALFGQRTTLGGEDCTPAGQISNKIILRFYSFNECHQQFNQVLIQIRSPEGKVIGPDQSINLSDCIILNVTEIEKTNFSKDQIMYRYVAQSKEAQIQSQTLSVTIPRVRGIPEYDIFDCPTYEGAQNSFGNELYVQYMIDVDGDHIKKLMSYLEHHNKVPVEILYHIFFDAISRFLDTKFGFDDDFAEKIFSALSYVDYNQINIDHKQSLTNILDRLMDFLPGLLRSLVDNIQSQQIKRQNRIKLLRDHIFPLNRRFILEFTLEPDVIENEQIIQFLQEYVPQNTDNYGYLRNILESVLRQIEIQRLEAPTRLLEALMQSLFSNCLNYNDLQVFFTKISQHNLSREILQDIFTQVKNVYFEDNDFKKLVLENIQLFQSFDINLDEFLRPANGEDFYDEVGQIDFKWLNQRIYALISDLNRRDYERFQYIIQVDTRKFFLQCKTLEEAFIVFNQFYVKLGERLQWDSYFNDQVIHNLQKNLQQFLKRYNTISDWLGQLYSQVILKYNQNQAILGIFVKQLVEYLNERQFQKDILFNQNHDQQEKESIKSIYILELFEEIENSIYEQQSKSQGTLLSLHLLPFENFMKHVLYQSFPIQQLSLDVAFKSVFITGLVIKWDIRNARGQNPAQEKIMSQLTLLKKEFINREISIGKIKKYLDETKQSILFRISPSTFTKRAFEDYQEILAQYDQQKKTFILYKQMISKFNQHELGVKIDTNEFDKEYTEFANERRLVRDIESRRSSFYFNRINSISYYTQLQNSRVLLNLFNAQNLIQVLCSYKFNQLPEDVKTKYQEQLNLLNQNNNDNSRILNIHQQREPEDIINDDPGSLDRLFQIDGSGHNNEDSKSEDDIEDLNEFQSNNKENQITVSISFFEELSEILIQTHLSTHFNKIYENDLANLKYFEMKLMWKNIYSHAQIEEELKILQNFYLQGNARDNQQKLTRQVIRIEQIRYLQLLAENAAKIIGLKQFHQYKDNLKEDTVINFLSELEVYVFAQEQTSTIQQLLTDFSDPPKFEHENFIVMQTLQSAFELYNFSQKYHNYQFQDLAERAADQGIYIDSQVFNCIADVTKFFKILDSFIRQQHSNQPFKQFVDFIVGKVNEKNLSKQKQKPNKQVNHSASSFIKDIECICSELANIITLIGSVNISETTLKLIEDLLTQGTIIFRLCDSGAHKILLQFKNQNRTMDNEEIVMHCNRAVLISNQKIVNKNQDGNFNKDFVNNFIKITEDCQKIRHILSQLQQYGHFEYQNFKTIELKFNDEQLVYNLMDICQQKQRQLEEWWQMVNGQRIKHHYLSFIPNKQLQKLLNFIQNPSNELNDQLLQTFQYINRNITVEQLKSIRAVSIKQFTYEESLNRAGQILEDIFSAQKDDVVVLDEAMRKKYKGLDNRKKKELNITWVQNDLKLIEAIMIIFASSGYYPKANQIIFCNQFTEIQEVEALIIRALSQYRNVNQQRLYDPVYVIAGLQNLKIDIQVHIYNYANKLIRDLPKDQSFNLFLISQSMDRRTSKVIEELKAYNYFDSINQSLLVKELFAAKFNNIQVVYSNQCGYGKSFFIQKCIESKRINYKRLSIMGGQNSKNLIDLHNKNLEDLLPGSQVGIHYDVSLLLNESINIQLFQLTVLESLRTTWDNIFIFKTKNHFMIELSQSILNQHQISDFFFNNLKQEQQVWDQNDIETSDKAIQWVCRALIAVEQPQVDIDYLYQTKERIIIEKQKCLELLRGVFINDILNPNYYILQSFVKFASDQFERMAKSAFFNDMSVLTDIFRNQVHQNLKIIIQEILRLSKNLSIIDQAAQRQQNALNNERIDDIQAHMLRNMKWGEYDNVFIMFNDSGSITPIYKKVSDINIALTNYFKAANSELKPYESLDQSAFHEKILEMCVDHVLLSNPTKRNKKIQNLSKIVFTKDNFMKLAMIYLRLRVKLPVIIMGETGVGKTAIVRCLTEVMEARFYSKNIHAGVSFKEIVSFIEEIQAFAMSDPSQKFIIFLDEINTNSNISGLIKEIIIDRHIQGIPLMENINLIAACNPYQLKGNHKTLSAGILHANQELVYRNQKLVYQVLPLPESMIQYIWDYGSLQLQEERQYIEKMINQQIIQKTPLLKTMNEQELTNLIKNLTAKLFYSQYYIKKNETPWSVSLRDVLRFCQLFKYFFEQNKHFQNRNAKNVTFQSVNRAYVLAISFCYYYRIGHKRIRDRFITELCNPVMQFDQEVDPQIVTQVQSEMITSINNRAFEKILMDEYDKYINEIEIPSDIGKNLPLKENIFIIITAFNTNMPLLLTGKPGSSKSLAVNLVLQSCRGGSSKKQIFQQLPALIAFQYQGSEQSTSEGIEKVFLRAKKEQKKALENKYDLKYVVVFDEIGLAEASNQNPLKVLHSLLEPNYEKNQDLAIEIPMIGISNWSLDAAKQNRAITSQRADPDEDALISIVDVFNTQQSQSSFTYQCLKLLTQNYLKYVDEQNREDSTYTSNFHGLRDYYSTIKQVYRDSVQKNESILSEENILKIINKAVVRNFNGYKNKRPDRLMSKMVDLIKGNPEVERINRQLMENISQDTLMIDNIRDKNSRHLLIITDNIEGVQNFIRQVCMRENIIYETVYGSDFSKDQDSEAVYKQINDIIFNMESGTMTVLMNLEQIYQSFYDMLNQKYQVHNKERICKVAIGSDSSNCLVHEDFKLILVVNEKQCRDMDPPLLNRFEKFYFTESLNLDRIEREVKDEVTQWYTAFTAYRNAENNNSNFTYNDSIKFFNEEFLASLAKLGCDINSQSNKNDRNEQEQSINKIDQRTKQKAIEFCQRQLVQLTNTAGILRAPLTQDELPNRYQFALQYIQSCNHFDIVKLLNNKMKDNQWGQINQSNENLNENNKHNLKSSLNLIIYTYSARLLDILPCLDQNILRVDQPIYLTNITSKDELKSKINHYYTNESNESNLLMILADVSLDSYFRISMCQDFLNQHIIQRNRRQEDFGDNEVQQKNACLIIKLDFTPFQGFSASPCWQQYQIDIFNGSDKSSIPIENLVSMSLQEIFSNDNLFRSLFDLSVFQIFSKLTYRNVSRSRGDLDFEKWIIQRFTNFYNLIGQKGNPDSLNFNVEIKTTIRQYLQIILQKEKGETFIEFSDNWKNQIITNQNLLETNLTFYHAALDFLINLISKYSAYIFYKMEILGYLNQVFAEERDLPKNIKDQLMQSSLSIMEAEIRTCNMQELKEQLSQETYSINVYDKDIYYPNIFRLIEIYMNLYKDRFETLHHIDYEVVDADDLNLLGDDKRIKIQQILKQGQAYDRIMREEIYQLKSQVQANFPFYEIKISENQFIEPFIQVTYNDESRSNQIFLQNCLELVINNNAKEVPQFFGIYWQNKNILEYIVRILKENEILNSDANGIFNQMRDDINKFQRKYQNDAQTQIQLPQLYGKAFIQTTCGRIYPTKQFLDRLQHNDIDWFETTSKLLIELRNIQKLCYIKEQIFEITELKFLVFFYQTFQQNYNDKVRSERETIKFWQQMSTIGSFLSISEFLAIIQNHFQDLPQDEEHIIIKKKLIYHYFFVCYDKEAKLESEELKQALFQNSIPMIFQDSDCFGNDQNQELQNLIIITFKKALYSIEKDLLNFFDFSINFDQLLQDTSDLVRFLFEFISNSDTIHQDHPFIVVLTDILEALLDYNLPDLEEITDENISGAIRLSLNLNISLLNKCFAVAYFRLIAQQFAEEISRCIIYRNHQFQLTSIQNFINEQFEQENLERSQPLMIYILKQLKKNFSISQIASDRVAQFVPWIRILNIQTLGRNSFLFIELKETFNRILGQISWEGFTVRSEYDRFNGVNGQQQSKQLIALYSALLSHYTLDEQEPLVLEKAQIDNCERLTDKQNNFIASQCGPLDARLIRFPANDQRRDIKMSFLQIGLSAISSHPNSIFSQIFENPQIISTIFLPFQLNVLMDIDYMQIFNEKRIGSNNFAWNQIARYKCRACQHIFIVMDCGALNDHRGANGQRVGGGRCQRCNANIGTMDQQNSEKIDNINRQNSTNFTDKEAERGYINYDDGFDDGIALREMKEIHFKLGNIIVHCVLYLSLLFCNQANNGLIALLSNGRLVFTKNDALEKLKRRIEYEWVRARTILQVNDEDLNVIIAYIMNKYAELSSSQNFQIQNFNTWQGRIAFEKEFIGQWVLNNTTLDQLPRLLQGSLIRQNTRIQHLINETNNFDEESQEIKNQFMFSLLRVQTKISVEQLKNYSSIQNQEQIHMMLNVFMPSEEQEEEQKEQVQKPSRKDYQKKQKITDILPIVKWIQFVYKNFSGKISFEEAGDKKLEDLLRHKLVSKDFQRAEKMLNNYLKAQNKYQELVIGFQCEQINIQMLDKKSSILYNCITNKKTEMIGLQSFLLLEQLCRSQNDKLQELCDITQQTQVIENLKKSKVPLMKIKDRDIIKEFDYSKLEREVFRNSFNSCIYGRGTQIYYNFDNLKLVLSNRIMRNTVWIDLEVPLDFEFINVGTLMDEYQQIKLKIDQVVYKEDLSQIIKGDIKANDLYNIYLQLRMIMRYMAQIGGQPEQSLSKYCEFMVGNEISQKIANSVQLKHTLFIFEHVEQLCRHQLIRQLNLPLFNQVLEVQTISIFREFLIENLKNGLLQEDDILCLYMAMLRFCSRLLPHNPFIKAEWPLFMTFFLENNEYLFGVQKEASLHIIQSIFESDSRADFLNEITMSQAMGILQIIAEIGEEIINRRQELVEEQRRDQENNNPRGAQSNNGMYQAKNEDDGPLAGVLNSMKPKLSIKDKSKNAKNNSKKPRV